MQEAQKGVTMLKEHVEGLATVHVPAPTFPIPAISKRLSFFPWQEPFGEGTSGELGLVHRNEKSGTLHGLMRVRCLTQDDAHIFMTEEQISGEIQNVARLIHEVYSKFGFDYFAELSTRPENSIGMRVPFKG